MDDDKNPEVEKKPAAKPAAKAAAKKTAKPKAKPKSEDQAAEADAVKMAAAEAADQEDRAHEMGDDTEAEEVEPGYKNPDVWLRGLWMIVLGILFEVAKTVLIVTAVIQFFWLLLSGEKNAFIKDFGQSLSDWMAKTAKFQTGVSEEKPFPWTAWKSE